MIIVLRHVNNVNKRVILLMGLKKILDLVSTSLMAYQPSWVIQCQIFVERRRYYLSYSWVDKGVHDYPKRISPNENIVERLELVYFDASVQLPKFILSMAC